MKEKKTPVAMDIYADGRRLNENPASAFRGLGCISANGSSRLLMDYKVKHPKVYHEILRLLFEPGYGAGLGHIKIELGADVNAGFGTEPCVKRSADASADVMRGAGFILAADAKKVNPALTVDLIRWGEPHWVTQAFLDSMEAGLSARYQWFYETILAAYQEFGLKFDYISADVSGTDHADTPWLLYFANRLFNEQDAPYDFTAIHIVASDESGSLTVANEMAKNPDMQQAVDVLGLHGTTYGDENTRFLHDICGKEIWYSEGAAPCNIPSLSCRVDGTGLGNANGILDIANRIINSYAHSRMVMYEFKPAVGAIYDGSSNFPCQLIRANTPWSGQYSLDAGFWIASHFTRFTEKGWLHFDAACFGDGDENEAIWNTTHNYMTLASPDQKYLTAHFCNDSNVPRYYRLFLRNLPDLVQSFRFIETAGHDDAADIGKNWFRCREKCDIVQYGTDACLEILVKPHSLLTVTNMELRGLLRPDALHAAMPAARMALPFDLLDESAAIAEHRGGIPLYTTDQGGAFEMEDAVLVQKITKHLIPQDWDFRDTPNPLTSFGDDSWSNYQCIATILLASGESDNYAGVGMRYNSAVNNPETAESGLMLRLYGNGDWKLLSGRNLLCDGMLTGFQHDIPHSLSMIAMGDLLIASIDGQTVFKQKLSYPTVRSGRMSLQSANYPNQFTQVKALPLPQALPPYCDILDCLSPSFCYPEDAERGWALDAMADSGFRNRTSASGEAGSVAEIHFSGNGIFLSGKTDFCRLSIILDGKLYTESVRIEKTNFREIFWGADSLRNGKHVLRLTILEGSLELDAAEIPTSAIRINDASQMQTVSPPRHPVRKPEPVSKSTWKRTAAVSIAAGTAAAAVAAGILLRKK